MCIKIIRSNLVFTAFVLKVDFQRSKYVVVVVVGEICHQYDTAAKTSNKIPDKGIYMQIL